MLLHNTLQPQLPLKNKTYYSTTHSPLFPKQPLGEVKTHGDFFHLRSRFLQHTLPFSSPRKSSALSSPRCVEPQLKPQNLPIRINENQRLLSCTL